eukprot:3920375-Rhodomonas_salina.1
MSNTKIAACRAVCGTELGARYALSATELAVCTAVCGTDPAQDTRRAVRYHIPLRDCYAISGTDLAHVFIRLGACYAMSGTDLAYGGISLRALYTMCGSHVGVSKRMVLSPGYYAMAGTELAYGAYSIADICAPRRGPSCPTGSLQICCGAAVLSFTLQFSFAPLSCIMLRSTVHPHATAPAVYGHTVGSYGCLEATTARIAGTKAATGGGETGACCPGLGDLSATCNVKYGGNADTYGGNTEIYGGNLSFLEVY